MSQYEVACLHITLWGARISLGNVISEQLPLMCNVLSSYPRYRTYRMVDSYNCCYSNHVTNGHTISCSYTRTSVYDACALVAFGHVCPVCCYDMPCLLLAFKICPICCLLSQYALFASASYDMPCLLFASTI